MTLGSRLFARINGLPPVRHRRVSVERDLRIAMPDGVVLRADRWFPSREPAAPILLHLTPYGPQSLLGRLCAERGYQAVIVRGRGTFGSGGEWQPFRHDTADGRTVMTWVGRQPWFVPRVGMVGSSYAGWAQWAQLKGAPPWLRAIAPGMSSSDIRSFVWPNGRLGLDSVLTWLSNIEQQEAPPLRRWLSVARGMRRLTAAASTVPLGDADRMLVGHRVSAYQDWLSHDSQDPWWNGTDHAGTLASAPPVNLVGGWYDPFLVSQLNDYRDLSAVGRTVRLAVGPWKHASVPAYGATLRETFRWMDQHLRGAVNAECSRVRVFVLGARRWLDLPSWPPASTPQMLHLRSGGRMTSEPPSTDGADRYTYDPQQPTPSVGGTSLHPVNSGRKNQRPRETRSDVLTYTSEPLQQAVTIIGEVAAQLFMRSSIDDTDVFVNLCDVDTRGRSTNICDGVVRLHTPTDVARNSDGVVRATITLSPTAATFAAGHRIRIQVSSGAHPRYARNPGSGEPIGKATTFVAADQQVLYGPGRPAAVVLPVVETIVPVHRRRPFASWRH
jgi:uncharacterized protein